MLFRSPASRAAWGFLQVLLSPLSPSEDVGEGWPSDSLLLPLSLGTSGSGSGPAGLRTGLFSGGVFPRSWAPAEGPRPSVEGVWVVGRAALSSSWQGQTPRGPRPPLSSRVGLPRPLLSTVDAGLPSSESLMDRGCSAASAPSGGSTRRGHRRQGHRYSASDRKPPVDTLPAHACSSSHLWTVAHTGRRLGGSRQATTPGWPPHWSLC